MQKSERVCEDCHKLSRQASGEEREEVDGPPSPRDTPKKQEGVLNVGNILCVANNNVSYIQ